FAGVAETLDVQIQTLPGFSEIPEVQEDGDTFEANARKKAEAYSLCAPGQIVIADDSGLSVDALGGSPGVHSARYAARSTTHKPSDSDNNYKLLAELRDDQNRSARFVCVIAAARDGQLLGSFRGEAPGEILVSPRGKRGFGYDPLFYVAEANQTFAEMDAITKSKYSHRGAAFREFLRWYMSTPPREQR
ncbi:MAG TPA: RdgB/HAM1 family non-canonical purine NTP pyrophosphatase, partial [Terriglobales bacterium]|nr:RdgB/HAM1 family non-canonical purine NTP pyrophosphatase [Terriglobales bacterium]